MNNLTLTLVIFFAFNVYSSNPSWIDLPKDKLFALSQIDNKKFGEIDKLISYYHSISKDSENLLTHRIDILSLIKNKLNIFIENEPCEKTRYFLSDIKNITRSKRKYLQELHSLYFVKKMSYLSLNRKFEELTSNLKKRHPIYLVNKHLYDSKKGILWGEYYLEILDPCHRHLTAYYHCWLEEKRKNPGAPLFFLWLENQYVPIEVPSIKFLSTDELKNTLVEAKDGLFYYVQKGTLVNCKPKKEYLFIIDLNENLFLIEGSTTIRHDSLSHGNPVLGAGNMIIENGELKVLGFDSGHYQTTIEDGLQVIDILQNKSFFLKDEVSVIYFFQEKKLRSSICEFIGKFKK